jgi:hypothetical protein
VPSAGRRPAARRLRTALDQFTADQLDQLRSYLSQSGHLDFALPAA